MVNIDGVSQAATETSAAADQVLSAATELSRQAERLMREVVGFIAKVWAAWQQAPQASATSQYWLRVTAAQGGAAAAQVCCHVLDRRIMNGDQGKTRNYV